jgi:hypothetical protein
MNNAQKILEKLQHDDIRPHPRWIFTSKEWIKWLAYITFILIGSLSLSIILFAISVNGFDMIQHFRHSGMEAVLVLAPILWLGLLIFFMGASIASIMQTGRAYKYSFSRWIGLSTGISLALGTLFFITGGAQWLEHKFETNIESYESLLEKKTTIWSQPELGTLSGEITDTEENSFTLKDWNSQLWTIQTTDAFIAPVLDIQSGVQVKINGKKVNDKLFMAEKIRPWGGAPGKCQDDIVK